MFKIMKEGAVIGMTEKPTYIRQSPNGCYVLCQEPDATGVAFNGTAYHLLGRDALEGAETVMLEEADAGTEILAARQAQEDADGMLVDQEYRLTLLELGLAE